MPGNENGRMKVMGWGFAIGFLIILPLFYLDYGDSEYPELNSAVKVVRHVSAMNQLKRSSFLAFEGEKSPSQFVRWMFSTLGTAEWYVSEGSGEFSQEEMKMIKKVTPLVPEDVSIIPNHPESERGKQVVVKPDDGRGMIIAEAYLNPSEAPVFVKEWGFPKINN